MGLVIEETNDVPEAGEAFLGHSHPPWARLAKDKINERTSVYARPLLHIVQPPRPRHMEGWGTYKRTAYLHLGWL
jgi:hypothetical protein